MSANHVLQLAQRVIARSQQTTPSLYLGIALRTAERLLECVPFVLCYVWLAGRWPDAVVRSPMLDWAPHWQLALGGLLPAVLLQWLCAYWGQRLTFFAGYQIMAAYRRRLLDHVHRLPIGVLQQQRGGELAEQLTDDVKKVEAIFTHLIPDIASALLAVSLIWLALAAVDLPLTLALSCALLPAWGLLQFSKRFFVRSGQEKQRVQAYTSGVLIEFVLGLRTLRLFDRTAQWLSRLNQQFERLRTLSLGVEAWGGGSVMAYRLVLEAGLPGLLLGMAWLTTQPDSSPAPHWLLFLLLAHKLLQPLLEVAETLTVLRYAAQCEQRLENLLTAPAMPEPEQPQRPTGLDIRFEQVSLAYEQEKVLHDISFTVPQGTLTALVGPSGSGKTSILNLLARFYDPSQGKVLLGGVDLRELGSEQLYQSLGMVFQQVQLHQGSIRDNIALSTTPVSDEAVQQACRDAWCDDFIRRLPAGYETQIGEGGMRLSGGERQRLSIARTLLKDAPVLLLDEATASVDPISQAEIQQALSRLAQGRTVVMIAHRLSTVTHADQILVLDQGRIIGQGTHSALLSNCPLYQRLWHAQHSQALSG